MVAAQRRRARMLLELGRADEALAEVRRILATAPNDPESLEIEGLCHLRRRDLRTALEVLGRAIAAAPDVPHPHYLYGFALPLMPFPAYHAARKNRVRPVFVAR